MTHASPLCIYNDKLAAGVLQADPGQAEAMARLDALFAAIVALDGTAQRSRLKQLFSRTKKSKSRLPKGLYLHGGVGRGKTMLMDIFAQAAKPFKCQRFHFHDFMTAAQNEIQAARKASKAEPIKSAAKALIKAAPIICFDEMEIRDIADAMIIQRLFCELWNQGMILITTSNRPPDLLYLNGLHRDRVLPFIADLNTRLEVHEIGAGQDWRKAFLQSVSGWHVLSLDAEARQAIGQTLDVIFEKLSGGIKPTSETMHFAGRALRFECAAGDVVDVDFMRLCGRPLGVRDYLAIADRFSGLIVRNIPVMSDDQQNEARRFMWLIDALYDRGRFLIASAEAQVEGLYCGERWGFEFERTCSRLQEMARLRGMNLDL